MNRKDYVVIASALARVRPSNGPLASPQSADYYRQWTVTRDAVMGALEDDNPLFDRARFIKASMA